MSTHKHIDLICVVVLVIALVLTLLFMNGTALGMQAVVDEDAEVNSDSSYFTSADLSASWDSASAVTVTLDGDGGSVKGNGAYFLDGDLVIAGGGTYVLTGTLTDGSIIIDAYDSSKVYLVLNGVSITCSDDACIQVNQADKVFLTLAEGSENTLTSGSEYSEAALEDNTDGVIFAHDDLTINGSGSLTVTGGNQHGIAANDDLVITGGNITVEASGDAIHVNDSLRICDATLNLTAGDEGIAVTNEENGYFYMESGTVTIHAADDGVHTAGDITIDGGTLVIEAGDDGIHSDKNVLVNNGTVDIPACYEGIEALTIEQTGGDITIYPTDDGLNANGGSSGFGGMMGGGMGGGRMGGGRGGFAQNSTDTATETTDAASDQQQSFTPPDFDSESGEMPTPPDFDSESGEMPTPPDRDSEDGESGEMPEMGEMPEQTSENSETAQSDSTQTTEDTQAYIRISGGTLTIINETGRDADGLDSNGNLYISGGTILVSLLGDGSNCAIDYASENGGVAEITGGTIIACGGSSMAEGFDSSSTQVSFLYNATQTLAAGTALTLTDSSGNTMLSWTLPCSASSIVMSSPELVQGESYTLTMGDTSETITLDSINASFGAAGGMGGGMMGGGRMGGWNSSNDQSGDSTESGFGGRHQHGGWGNQQQNSTEASDTTTDDNTNT